MNKECSWRKTSICTYSCCRCCFKSSFWKKFYGRMYKFIFCCHRFNWSIASL